VHDGIEGKRNLLAEEMLRYFGETCPALAERCEVAIVALPPLARRELAGRLQTLGAATNETNRELSTVRVAVAKGQAPTGLLLDRALASIEHLSEIARTMTRWMDELLEAQSLRQRSTSRSPIRLISQPMQPLRILKRRAVTCSSSQQTNPDEPFPRCSIVRVRWRGNVLPASFISTPVSTPSSPTGKVSARPYEPAHAGGQLEKPSHFIFG